VTETNYEIIDSMGQLISFDWIPIPLRIENIPGRISRAKNEILFKTILPPLGFNSFYFSKIEQHQTKYEEQMKTFNEQCILQNQVILF